MLGSFDGQTVSSIVVDHIRDGQKSAREIAEHELTGTGVSFDPHVHHTFGTPAKKWRIFKILGELIKVNKLKDSLDDK